MDEQKNNTTGNKTSSAMDNLYTLDNRPPLGRSILVGLQHLLAMFVSNITPIMILSNACSLDASLSAALLQNAMIIAGLGTLLQLFTLGKIGSGLPLVVGTSFTYLNSAIIIASNQGLEVVMGAIIAGGIILCILGLLARWWVRYISPLVSGLVVMSIGFSLLSVGASSFAGGSGAEHFASLEHWIVGGVTLLTALILTAFSKGFIKIISVLFALILGYVVSLFFGMVDFSVLADTKILTLPAFLPFKPVFQPGAILSFLIFYIVTATEVIGNSSAVCDTGLNRGVESRELSGGIASVGLMSIFSGLFGCIPITVYGQNVGLVAMTKVINRFAIACGALIMIVAGIFPVFGALLTTVPQSVLGGCTLMAFGSILAAGLQMISRAGYNPRNWTIISFTLSVSFGFSQIPQMFHIFPKSLENLFSGNAVVMVFLISLILDLILPKKDN